MASPAQLVTTLSEATGVPLATVVDIDRRLVKGGLRSKGGRGLHAARMTPLDAARLLTAILASAQANLAVAAVHRYARTQVDRARSSEQVFAASGLADLAGLPHRHSFVEGLAAVIGSVAKGALARMFAEQGDHGTPPRIEVFAFTHAAYGRIRLAGLPGGTTAAVEYLPAGGLDGRRAKATGRGIAGASENTADLEQSRRVTERTILAIATLLAEEIENGRA